MATYEDIYGKRVKEFDSDPTLTSSYEGQVWYDKSTGVLKSVVSFDSFTSSTPYTTGRRSFGSSGTQTANLIYAGSTGSASNATEEYNGSGWTTGGNFGSSGYTVRGMGTQTAALSAGLFTPGGFNSATYKYDGTSWTSAGALPANRASMGTAGTQTAGLAFGGSTGPAYVNTGNSTYEYDGSSWTAGNNLNTGRTYLGGFGTQTAAAGCGGYTGSPNNTTTTGATEEYDGTNWSTSGSMNTARRAFATSGIQTAGLAFGGTTGSNSSAAEKYDGSTWATSSATLGTATRNNGGSPAGTQSAAISTEGGSSPYGAKTEEFNASINTFTAAAWASGGTLPITMRQNMSFGTQTAAINCGGYAPPGTKDDSLSYDGTSWTATPDLNAAARFGGVAGTQGAGLQFSGIQPDSTLSANVQSWNGSTWSNNPYNVSTGTYGNMGCGTQSAALKLGGAAPPPTNTLATTEEYDGEGWTAGGTMPNPRYGGGGNGLQTTCVFAGGDDSVGPPSTSTTSAEYDGTSWTAGGSLNDARGSGAMGAGASSDSALVFGGAPAQSFNEGYDGTSFSTRPSLATGRGFSGGNGIATAALIVAGGPPSGTTTNVEEFTGETETITSKTLTTS